MRNEGGRCEAIRWVYERVEVGKEVQRYGLTRAGDVHVDQSEGIPHVRDEMGEPRWTSPAAILRNSCRLSRHVLMSVAISGTGSGEYRSPDFDFFCRPSFCKGKETLRAHPFREKVRTSPCSRTGSRDGNVD